MQLTVNEKRRLSADVVVVGGGTAGVFAAISAAASGAVTILVEKNAMLGGTMTVANVNFPGLFFAWGKQIISGPCWESLKRAEVMNGAQIPEISYRPKYHWDEQIVINRYIYASVLIKMCEERGVKIITNAMLSYIEETNDGILLAIVEKDGVTEIKAKNVIDATGDANLVVQAGYKTLKSEIQQPATLQNHITGYSLEDISPEDVETVFKASDFPEYIDAKCLYRCLELNKIDIHIPSKDCDTSEGRTRLEHDTSELMIKIYNFLRTIKGLENLTIDFAAEETGVRETNRIVGEKMITSDEYITGFFYPDSVCYSFYPIDLHIMTGVINKYHKNDVVSKIPYGALIPKGSKHILCAGRCISSDAGANSAIRTQATCMATGQAAGCAAALASKSEVNVSEVDYEELCGELNSIGAIVPEMFS